NTLGAAAGALVAGFVLLPAVGLFTTIVIGMGASALAAAIALLVYSRHHHTDGEVGLKPDATPKPAATSKSATRSRAANRIATEQPLAAPAPRWGLAAM